MSGDYTRFTHRPHQRFNSVLMQQGRVQLDADWNEHVAIGKSRWETQAKDTFGPAAVPRETTPDGFKISAIAAGDFDISPGRMYVDGLLAEIFDDEHFSYLHQPYLINPPALPANGGAIVYLDVWDREVTYVEDSELLEKALGGPDTATRLQTVWQVKVATVADAKCGDDLNARFPPSGGLLTTAGIGAPASNDPCVLNPTGGYRGLENRLYRVEIHDGGNMAAATFKWSRENASIASPAKIIDANTVEVRRIGRDKVLRFQQSDWIEIQDDVRELRGDPGVIVQLSAQPDEAMLRLTFAPAINPADFDATRNIRVKRWDQRASVNAGGLVPVSTTSPGGFELEVGVQVTFGLTGGAQFKPGDYWVFAARTADASVEPLNNAPPRGIIHHYAQLAAFADVTSPALPADCRPLWPPSACCCCTFEVGTPGSHHGDFDTLAAAVASIAANTQLTDKRVRICLLPGRHTLTEPVTIERGLLDIVGCGSLTIVEGPAPLLVIAAHSVAVRNIAFKVTSAPNNPAIRMMTGGEHEITGCTFETTGTAVIAEEVRRLSILDNVFTAAQAVLVSGAGVEIAGNRISHNGNASAPAALTIATSSRAVRITDNVFLAPNGHAILISGEPMSGSKETTGIVTDVTIERNLIGQAAGCGILALPAPLRTDIVTIRDNVITNSIRSPGEIRGGLPNGGIVLQQVSHVIIDGNRIVDNGDAATSPVAGVFIRDCRGLVIRNNVITGNGPAGDVGQVSPNFGGILGDDLSVVLEEVQISKARTSFQTDGWPAAVVQGNVVVAPRGPVLRLTGVGPMRITGNNLTAREILEGQSGVAFSGAVQILNTGVPAYAIQQLLAFGFTTKTFSATTPAPEQLAVSGLVDFSNNVVTLDLIRNVSDFAIAATAIATLDDLAFQNNQTQCSLGLDFVLIDALLIGTTLRVTGNGFMESLLGCFFSAFGVGLALCTVALNQGTHCIRFALADPNNPAQPPARIVFQDNLQPFCQRQQG